mmetsp:Transcript_14531/g.31308  ORF Transcript_14531/g.31308 Transcript_14531/m.31308 type:complete len:268 (+) Transcript_14531:299-1102(+)
MALHVTLTLQLWQNLLRQCLTQLNTPLIKSINIPNSSLSKDLHLIHGNKNSKHTRSELLEEHGGGRTISLEYFVRYKCFHLFVRHGSLELCTDSLGRFAKCHSFRLSKVVREKDGMVIDRSTQFLDNIVVCLNGSDEIAWDNLGSLMKKLIECMLSVCSWLTPDHRPRLNIDTISILANVLSIRLHVSLLKVRRETMHVLIIRKDSQTLRLVEVIVPNTDHCQCDGQVLLNGSIQEVLVHRMSTGMHFHPVVKSQRECNGGTNGTPQ